MAGFLGFGNFSKVGKGVKKDEPQKKRFFLFFEIFFRKMFNLVKLNLLFLLFCIPIVTIGPATAAMMKIARYYIEAKPVFLFSDFFDAFKENFKQGIVMGFLSLAVFLLSFISLRFYYLESIGNNWYLIPLAVIGFVSLVALFSSFYTYLLICTVNLKMIAIIKNAVMYAFIGLKSNICTLFFTALIAIPSVVLIPYTIIIILLISFSLCSLIICFNSFQYVYKYTIKPYYEANGLVDPYATDEEDVETIFEDAT